jgi:hypothetical protein
MGRAVTDLDHPTAALAGCTLFHNITIHYPVQGVPDYKSPGRRDLRPSEVSFYASRHNAGPWQLSSPLVIGREILKSGALGSVERARSTVIGSWPDWLAEVTGSVRKALDAGLDTQPTRHAPLTDEPTGGA